jgi:hypothetical protein
LEALRAAQAATVVAVLYDMSTLFNQILMECNHQEAALDHKALEAVLQMVVLVALHSRHKVPVAGVVAVAEQGLLAELVRQVLAFRSIQLVQVPAGLVEWVLLGHLQDYNTEQVVAELKLLTHQEDQQVLVAELVLEMGELAVVQ